MSDRDELKQKRKNDSLQSGEGDLAYGEDARDFGVGGQQDVRPLNENEAELRKPDRDPTVPEGQNPSRRYK